MSCVFCRIVAGELPADRVGEGESWIAFRDLNPQAPVHLLVVPRDHIESLSALDESQVGLAGELLRAAAKMARSEGLTSAGYRVVTNTGHDGGQSVAHLHLHVLGGRVFDWPPG